MKREVKVKISRCPHTAYKVYSAVNRLILHVKEAAAEQKEPGLHKRRSLWVQIQTATDGRKDAKLTSLQSRRSGTESVKIFV